MPCAQAKNVAVVVVTGDRGLCGGYNAQMIKKAEARIVELQSQVRRPCLPLPLVRFPLLRAIGSVQVGASAPHRVHIP